MVNRTAVLETALADAARLFREYEALHTAKLKPDLTPLEHAERAGKVARNRLAAEQCEAALATPQFELSLAGTALDPTT